MPAYACALTLLLFTTVCRSFCLQYEPDCKRSSLSVTLPSVTPNGYPVLQFAFDLDVRIDWKMISESLVNINSQKTVILADARPGDFGSLGKVQFLCFTGNENTSLSLEIFKQKPDEKSEQFNVAFRMWKNAPMSSLWVSSFSKLLEGKSCTPMLGNFSKYINVSCQSGSLQILQPIEQLKSLRFSVLVKESDSTSLNVTADVSVDSIWKMKNADLKASCYPATTTAHVSVDHLLTRKTARILQVVALNMSYSDLQLNVNHFRYKFSFQKVLFPPDTVFSFDVVAAEDFMHAKESVRIRVTLDGETCKSGWFLGLSFKTVLVIFIVSVLSIIILGLFIGMIAKQLPWRSMCKCGYRRTRR